LRYPRVLTEKLFVTTGLNYEGGDGDIREMEAVLKFLNAQG